MAQGTWIQSKVVSYQKLLKRYLLNIHQYKVRIKGKVEQSREMSNALV